MTLTLSKTEGLWVWSLRSSNDTEIASAHVIALTPQDALNQALLGIYRQLNLTVTKLAMGRFSLYPSEWRLWIGNGPEFRGAGPFESTRAAFEHAINATMMAERSEYAFDVEVMTL